MAEMAATPAAALAIARAMMFIVYNLVDIFRRSIHLEDASLAWAIVAAVLAFFTLLPVAGMAVAWGFFAYRSSKGYRPPQPLPEVAVLLPLRGADPSLEACLKGLLAQDYPAYRAYVVIDSAEDPAQAVVARVLDDAGPRAASVHVETRRVLGTDCSAKLSAQLQVLTALDAEVAVIAFLDADCIPSPNWLREIVAPFSDRASERRRGIRWSAPGDEGWGTLARYVFLGLIFPQHFLYRIPWGGSFAIRRSAIESTGLLEHWTHCIGEDTSAYGPLRKAGLRLAFVPAATQVNSEATDLDGAHAFMLRQVVERAAAPRLLAADPRGERRDDRCVPRSRCLLALVGIVGGRAVGSRCGDSRCGSSPPSRSFRRFIARDCCLRWRSATGWCAGRSPHRRHHAGPKVIAAAAIAAASSTYAMLGRAVRALDRVARPHL